MALEKALHTPSIVSDKGELSLLPEDKRSCLWIADLTGEKKGEGRFRPFFPLSAKELDVIPGEGLPITEKRRGAEDLFKTGVIHKLVSQHPARWQRPIRLMGTAMLLAFSFCEEDGSEFSDELWRVEDSQSVAFKINDARLMGLGRKLVAYIRHFGLLGQIEERTSPDSDRELLDAEYTRKRRIDFPMGLLGDVEYSVTFFDREDGMFALGCKPHGATLRHKGDLVYSLPTSAYEEMLVQDSLGGANDDYFTVAQLAWAKVFETWLNNIAPYVSSFVGLV
jgi:hypothetical protein